MYVCSHSGRHSFHPLLVYTCVLINKHSLDLLNSYIYIYMAIDPAWYIATRTAL